MADSTDEDPPECHQCGEPVAPSSEHRVVTALEDGQASYLYFCTDECLENWDSASRS
ncbi:DUF7576 family protein [Natronorubrum halophilum]|uniref:DUF7576 family protein n=1 Tax=Natronorubrum halophilum TaxID=1702106 RepID=UPI0013CEF692|nr:hypothetical protein [Natronorubrum halophilum]